MKKLKIVEIEWEDAWTSPNTFNKQELKDSKPLILKSSGYLIHEDKQKVVLSSDSYEPNIDGEECWRHVMSIPKDNVKRRRTLR
jgi:hypothetical protein